jgi:hypothetical protein
MPLFAVLSFESILKKRVSPILPMPDPKVVPTNKQKVSEKGTMKNSIKGAP